ncbi:hypothetical protein [Pseudomonas sp. ML96]|uniref:hypothetical protein n=1 Tax=Pseudomonas sp. ML96 TaxID=1523503 RepID=UPI0005BCC34B|nr:hypothetical protein [Pseudomonas sp. ML96]
MSRRPPALLFTIVALASCLLGYWFLTPREDKPAPSPWLQQWDVEVLRPLLEDRLTVGDLSQRLSASELWLQPRLDGPRLLLRGELDGWQVEGELTLSDAQRASLAAASGVRPNDPEQPQSAEMLTQLAGRNIEGLNLLPQQLVPATTLSASLGEPRLRLQLQEGEAWVYPQQGLTAHIKDGHVQLLRAVPKRLLQH